MSLSCENSLEYYVARLKECVWLFGGNEIELMMLNFVRKWETIVEVL